MSRRIDIELTSTRDDGTWTWRAAGAKQPKGALAGSLLPEGATVGEQLRADVETTLDGTVVLAVLPPKSKSRAEVETIELIARGPSDDQLVITTLAPKGGRGGRDRGDRGDRGDRRPPRDGDRRGRAGGDRPGGDRGRPGEGRGRGDRPGGDRPGGDRPGGRGDRPERRRRERSAPPARPKAKRLRPGRTHRKAALDLLAPEEQVVAEQLLRGGVPAVRQAVEKQNEQARVDGRPEVRADALVAVAEKLLPNLRSAEWRDRAEAAVADLDELDLRDLRSVVVAADTGANDDESRELAARLREGLNRRVDQEQAAWLAEIAETLADGRVVRALRLSSRPPKAGAPLPVDLATKLAEAASAALTADTVVDRWATVLDALSFSPVRLTVAPASKPAEPSDELVAAIARVAARTPKVAEAFGITPPPESARRRGGRPARSGGGKGGSGTGKGGAKGGGRSGPKGSGRADRPAPEAPVASATPPADGSLADPAVNPDPAPAAAAPAPGAETMAAPAAAPDAPAPDPGPAPDKPAAGGVDGAEDRSPGEGATST